MRWSGVDDLRGRLDVNASHGELVIPAANGQSKRQAPSEIRRGLRSFACLHGPPSTCSSTFEIPRSRVSDASDRHQGLNVHRRR